MLYEVITRVKALIAKYNICCENIILEITETAVIRELNVSLQVLKQLRRLNVRIALDDFGTGYSSFNYLKNLPIDIVKLDRSFVKEIANNCNDT